MNILDLILLSPIVIGFIFGLFKGLIKELTSLAAIVLGIFGARMFEPHLSELLLSVFDMQPGMVRVISYLLLFVAIALLLLMLANMLDKLFSAVNLGGLNKFLGGLFGALKFALIVSVLLNVFDAFDKRFSFLKEETKKESLTYESILNFGSLLWDEAKDVIFEPENEDENNEDSGQSFANLVL